jgi:cytochrome c-type biogenesis protein CcmH
VAAFAVVPVTFGIYKHVSTWDPQAAHRADEGQRVVAELAARLKKSPDNVEGWLLLGRSYMVLGEYEQGRDAYHEAFVRTPEPDSELKIAYAEAQVLAERSVPTGEARKLIEEVLEAEPSNPKALYYGGLAALEDGREDVVKARWSRLLELDPPEEVASILRAQLAALGAPAEGKPVSAGGASGGAASGPTVQLAVTLGAGRSIDQLPPSTQLFILARAPSGGPPLAVIRQPASAVPGQFTLSDANSMIPGRSLADYEELTLVARLSRSGQPVAQPGDWEAQAKFRPKDGGTVALVIDQVVQ